LKPLTKSQFRWLLVVYCVLVAVSSAADAITKSMIPESVVQAQSASDKKVFSQLGSTGNTVLLLTLVGVLVAAVVGLWLACFFFGGQVSTSS
jgi:uncharacterized membrane protein